MRFLSISIQMWPEFFSLCSELKSQVPQYCLSIEFSQFPQFLQFRFISRHTSWRKSEFFNHTISRILTQQEILFDFLHARHTQKNSLFFLCHKWWQKMKNLRKWISDKRIFNRSGTILIIWSLISLLDDIIYKLYLDVFGRTRWNFS